MTKGVIIINIENTVRNKLFEFADNEYKVFSQKLIPTVCANRIIGVRTPIVRNLAKEMYKNFEWEDYIKILPHKFYEENNLHAFIIEQIKDYDKVIFELNRFLPYVDNWATCDSLKPKIFIKNLEKLENQITIWLKSKDTFTVRFGIEMLMNFYLDENFKDHHIQLLLTVKSKEYYINMMLAWYFATALSKKPEYILPIFEQKILSPWVHNKAIQKSIESYRISEETKKHLKTLKIK